MLPWHLLGASAEERLLLLTRARETLAEWLPERPGDLDEDAVLRTRSGTNNFPKRLDERTIVIVDHLGAREVHFPLDEGAVFHTPILPLVEHEGVPLRGVPRGHRTRAAGRPARPKW